MTMLRCPFCAQAADGLTLYLTPGHARLLVCPGCYALLVSKERQPHSQPMKRLRRLLGHLETEVMTNEGVDRFCSVAGTDDHNGSLTRRESP